MHARSIFLQGLLVNDLELSPKKFSKFKSIFDSWQRLCKKNKISRINACINFILNLSFVSKLIIGFKNSEEVKELSKIQGHKIDFYNKKIFKKIPQNLKDPNLWKNIK